MSNGRSFRPVTDRTRHRAKARALRGPMGRVRVGVMSVGSPRDPSPWATGSGARGTHTGLRAVGLRAFEDSWRRLSPWPLRLAAHDRLPRAKRRPLTLADDDGLVPERAALRNRARDRRAIELKAMAS